MTRSRIIMVLGIGIIALLTALGIRQVSIGTQKLASAQAAVEHGRISIDQRQEVFIAESMPLCAYSTSTDINLSRLVWTHHRMGSMLTRPAGMADNCRLYTAPPNPGWDRVKVSYHSKTLRAWATTTFSVLPQPSNP